MILENTILKKQLFTTKKNQEKILANYKLTNEEYMQVIKAGFTIQEIERIIEGINTEYKKRKTITTKDNDAKKTIENVLAYLTKEKKDVGESIYALLENRENILTEEEKEIVGILSDDAIKNGIFTKRQLTEKLLALHAKTELDKLLDTLKYHKKKKYILLADDAAILVLADTIRHLENRQKNINEILNKYEEISDKFSEEVQEILKSNLPLEEINKKENQIRVKYRQMNLENEIN